MTMPIRRRRRSPRRSIVPAVVMVGLAAGWALMWPGRLIARHEGASILAVALLLAAAAAGAVGRAYWLQARARGGALQSATLAQLDAMDDREFEYALRDFVIRDGCRNARRVGGAGDLGADVLAVLPDGRKLVIQAKRYRQSNRVGSGDVQKVGGTWQTIHGCDVAAVVTTSTFTRAAADYCRRAGIHAMGREQLAAWASRTGPAPWH